MFPRRGEIWFVRLPRDPKERPGVVISPDFRNERSASILIIPITTNLRPLSTHVFLPAGEAGLAFDSMVRCENVTTVEKVDVRRGPYNGVISPNSMERIKKALLIALDIQP